MFRPLSMLVEATLALSPVAALASPMSTTPAHLVDRLLSDFAAENLSSIERYTASDVTMLTQLPMEQPIRWTGRAQIAAYFRTVFERYDSITSSHVIKTPAADGRTIVVEANGTYRTAQVETHTVGYVWFVRTSHDKIAAYRNYTFPLPEGTTQP